MTSESQKPPEIRLHQP